MIDRDAVYEVTHRWNKRLLWCIGLWPYQTRSIGLFLRWFWIIQHVTIMIPEVWDFQTKFSKDTRKKGFLKPELRPLLHYLIALFWSKLKDKLMAVRIIRFVEIRRNIEIVLECLPPLIYNLGCAIKFGNQFLRYDRLKKIRDKIKSQWKILSEPELTILTRYTNTGKYFSYFYVTMAYVVIFFYMVLPITPIILNFVAPLNESRPRKPLYEAQYFVDVQKYFYPILAHAYITSLCGITAFLAVDTTYMAYMQYTNGMFAVLRYRLEAIASGFEGSDTKFHMAKENDKMFTAIREFVLQHKEILALRDNLQDIYSMSFFYQLAISMPLMSITGIVTVMKWGHFDMIRFGTFTFAQISHLFYNSFPGEVLMDESYKIYLSAYNCKWYVGSYRLQRAIQVIMMRCQIKCILTAGPIYVLCMENFAAITKAAMSFFTVLKSTGALD